MKKIYNVLFTIATTNLPGHLLFFFLFGWNTKDVLKLVMEIENENNTIQRGRASG